MMVSEEGLLGMVHSEVILMEVAMEEAIVVIIHLMAYFHPPKVMETIQEAIMDHSHRITGWSAKWLKAIHHDQTLPLLYKLWDWGLPIIHIMAISAFQDKGMGK
jgi:hypothetical protein